MTDELAGKIVDAYKSSPLLTGLLLLNIAIVGGFGWWEYKRVTATDVFVQAQLAKQDRLQAQLVEMADRCAGRVAK